MKLYVSVCLLLLVAITAEQSFIIEYLLLGGGGGGGYLYTTEGKAAGGGGGGEFVTGAIDIANNISNGVSYNISIVVGSGASDYNVPSGSSTFFGSIVAMGGGSGGNYDENGHKGSCGGGGGSYNTTGGNGVSQSCYNGAGGFYYHNKYNNNTLGGCGGGGGGVGGPGGHGGGHCTYDDTSKTDGGDGLQSNITGSFKWYGGGGAGCSVGTAVSGVGYGYGTPGKGQGDGSGGGGSCGKRVNGQSGVVVLSYPKIYDAAIAHGNHTVEEVGNNRVYIFNSDGYIVFFQCFSGYYESTDVDGNRSCTLCAAGSYQPKPGQFSCAQCERDFYQDQTGAVTCKQCPSGTISAESSVDVLQCFNPTPNIAISMVCLALSVFGLYVYAFHGRFHHVAFRRRYRVTKHMLKLINSIREKVEYGLRTVPVRDDILFDTSTTERALAAYVFFVFACLIILVVTCFISAIGTLGFLAFKAVLLNRIVDLDLHLFDNLKDAAKEVASSLGMPFLFDILSSLLGVFQILDLISLDFGAIGVTCRGLIGAVELFTNIMIIGFAIIYIESDSQFIQELLFARSDHSLSYKVYQYTGTRQSGLQGWKRTRWTMYAAGSCILLGFNPFVNLIQLLMGMLFFNAFIEDNGMHASSAHCHSAGGLVGIDPTVAVLTTFVAIISAPCCIYATAQVLLPMNSNTIERFDDKDRVMKLNRQSSQRSSSQSENVGDAEGAIHTFISSFLCTSYFITN